MSVETLKSELAKLSNDDRRELVAYLVQLNRRQSGHSTVSSLAAVLDDSRPGQWLTLDEADQRLDWLPELQASHFPGGDRIPGNAAQEHTATIASAFPGHA